MDLIDRQAAIDALLGITAMRNTIPLDSAIFNIKKLPSAQPEVIRCKDCKSRYIDCPMHHVEWIEYDDDGYIEVDDIVYDYTKDDGFCYKGVRDGSDKQTGGD